MPPGGVFRWSATKYHLTYRGHIDFEIIKAKLRSVRPWTALSLVHEIGDVDEESATPYAHTHVAVLFKSKLDSTDVGLFDIDDVHPHAKNRRSLPWIKYLFDKYHKGHKVKASGKKYFLEPVLLEQDEPQDWK